MCQTQGSWGSCLVLLKLYLGNFSQRNQSTEVVDTFEITSSSNDGPLDERDIVYLKERMELRLKGDQWNLFKDLDIVGWYSTTEKATENDVLLHK
jgi:JAB1/Mov34/MPN/PAD-1 ubiquitin protease